MRRNKRNRSYIGVFLVLGVIAVTLPLSWNILSVGVMPAMESITQKAAMLSMLMSMPEGGIALLEEKFNSEYFSSDDLGEDYTSPEIIDPVINPLPSSSSEISSSSEVSSSSSSSEATPPPEIPSAHRGDILEEDFSGYDSKIFIPLGTGYLRNYTELTEKQILKHLEKPLEMVIADTTEPQVLIIHTHATESYEEYDAPYYDKRNNWRSTDNTKNMVAVGEALAQSLRENGIEVVHDTTQHDYPSYNGSYERSAKTIKENLAKYPSIKVVLDVHRDAIERTGEVIVKPTTVIDGKKAAQLMIITGSEDGTMNVPNWPSNLRFASAFTNYMEEDYKTLSRPIFFCYRKYNMDLSKGSLLLEFGSHANTLDEAKYTATLAGKSLARLLKDLIK